MSLINQSKLIKAYPRRQAVPRRTTYGACLVEMPLVLFVIFVLMLVPMLSLASIALRSALMSALVIEGAHAASKAKTFAVGTPAKPAAVTVAEQRIRAAAENFSGLRITTIDTDVLATRIGSDTTMRYEGALSEPADTSNYTYQIETTAQGQIDPVIRGSAGTFGAIPGLTGPIRMAWSAREWAENPQGLHR